jgi:adenine-specific DNA-methyltransferase
MIISIDDHEVAQLKLLCDELFNNNPNPKSSNQIGFLIWDLGTGTSAGHFTRTNEFILVYAKNKKSLPNFSGGEGVIDDRAQKKIGIKNPASDFTFPAGTKFEAEERLELTDSWGGAEKSTLIKGKLKCEGGKTTEEVTIKAGWTQKRQMQSFFEGEKTIDSKGQEVLEFYFRSNGKIYCRKLRDKLNPPSVLREVATTKQGSSMLKLLFNGEEPIQYVKPVQLIQYFLKLMPEKKTILDFFAGSGTTLHSTISQNDEDQGNRTCIIATNNENKIAEEVAYIRNKKIIEGYQAWKSDFVSGLTTNNLRYYQCEFVDSISSEINKRKLSTLCTELLCIKEDCYFDQSANYNLPFQKLMLFTNDSGKYFMVVFHSRKMNESFEKVINLVPKLNTKEKIKIYAFSEEKETLSEELFEIRDLVETVPLPQAIYNAYRATFRDLKIDL